MKLHITAIFALFFFLQAGTSSATLVDKSASSLQTLQTDMMCAEKKEKKKVEEEEPECD